MQTEAQKKWFPFQNYPRKKDTFRIFCFPHAGGNASYFHSWISALQPTGLNVYPVQLPGRANRMQEPRLQEFSQVIPPLIAILESFFDVPFAFFGHSMGALLSFELARALRRAHYPLPSALFLSATSPPHLIQSARLENLPDALFVENLTTKYHSIPVEISSNTECLALFLPTLRADFSLLSTYAYREEDPLDCFITCFAGLDDPDVKLEELPSWQRHTSQLVEIHTFPGDHFFLQRYQQEIFFHIQEKLQFIRLSLGS